MLLSTIKRAPCAWAIFAISWKQKPRKLFSVNFHVITALFYQSNKERKLNAIPVTNKKNNSVPCCEYDLQKYIKTDTTLWAQGAVVHYPDVRYLLTRISGTLNPHKFGFRSNCCPYSIQICSIYSPAERSTMTWIKSQYTSCINNKFMHSIHRLI